MNQIALDNEKSVLGAAFMDTRALDTALDNLKATDFAMSSHQHIFKTLAEMAEGGIEPDMVTLSTELEKRGGLDRVGGSAYLSELLDFVPSPGVAPYCCKQVKEQSKRRMMMDLASMIQKSDLPTDELKAKVEEQIFGIDTEQKGQQHVKEVAKTAFKEIEELHQNGGKITGLETGFHDLDGIINGLNPPDLTIIAARPGMGKTAFAGGIVENVAIRGGNPVLINTLEMSNSQLFKRMLFGRSRVNGARARVGNFQQADWSKMTNAIGEIAKSPIFFDETPGLHVSEIRARARSLKRRQGISLVVVDYLQLVRGDGDSRAQEVGNISRSLKGMAKELHVPVVALCQLSRKLEERQNKRPIMSDLRDSGEIEQDADNIIFLYRDAEYNTNADQTEAEAIIAKQRNGPTGVVDLVWLGEFSRYENKHNR